MLRNPKFQSAILGGGFVLLLAILAWHVLSGQRRPSPEELARRALEAPTAGEQEVAAVRLAQLAGDNQVEGPVRKEAGEHLRRVLANSQSPPVRAACLVGLASQWDYDSMPVFLEALEDSSPLVRGSAETAVRRMLSVDLNHFNYRHDDPPEKRQQAVKLIAEYWEQMRDSPLLRSSKKRLQEQGS